MKKYLLPILLIGSASVACADPDVAPVPLPEMAVVETRADASAADALIVDRVAPEYPHELLRQGTSGRVRVELAIDRRGTVRSVNVLKADDPALSDAVRRAVWKWRFVPTREVAGRDRWRARMTFRFEIVDPA